MMHEQRMEFWAIMAVAGVCGFAVAFWVGIFCLVFGLPIAYPTATAFLLGFIAVTAVAGGDA